MRATVEFVVAVLLISCLMLLYENRKTNDNLPSGEACLAMEDTALKRRVSGYMEHQLLEVWGNPSYNDPHNLVWKLPEGALIVSSDSQGKVVSCIAHRMVDLPVLNRIASMSEKELTACLSGWYADQVRLIWGEPEEENQNEIDWRLPVHSPHRLVSIEVNEWNMVISARFQD